MINVYGHLSILLVLALITLSCVTQAKPSLARMTNIQVDSYGNLISPDLYHYKEALKFYNKGDKATSLLRFKFSAEFGNRNAIKFIGLMYLGGDGIPLDIFKGQAWLKLAASRGDRESIKITKKFENENSVQDNSLVKKIYAELLNQYGRTVVMNNAYKYYRRFKFQTLARPNSIKFQKQNVVLSEMKIMRLSHQVKDFYLEIKQNLGTVIQGEIVPKDE